MDLTSRDRHTVKQTLNDLLQVAERIASSQELSDGELVDLVNECEAGVKLLMDPNERTEARDGNRKGESMAASCWDEPIEDLMRQVDDCLRRCIERIAARKQSVADDLGSMRLTQRATKAYQEY